MGCYHMSAANVTYKSKQLPIPFHVKHYVPAHDNHLAGSERVKVYIYDFRSSL